MFYVILTGGKSDSSVQVTLRDFVLSAIGVASLNSLPNTTYLAYNEPERGQTMESHRGPKIPFPLSLHWGKKKL